MTISCQGPPGADLYRLEELISRKYLDQAELSISAMEQRFVGRYRCSYQSGTTWSPPSNQLELVATGNWAWGAAGFVAAGLRGPQFWAQTVGVMVTVNPKSQSRVPEGLGLGWGKRGIGFRC